MSEYVLGGRYRLQSIVGRGGMAVVWRGVDVRLGRPVAVKLLDGTGLADLTTVQRFTRKARTVARLTHPNIVAMYDFGTDGGVPYLVMELVEGASLATILADGPLDVGEAVAVAGQICDALAAAHAAGVVHRDVKPANVLITEARAVKVCDFGIARLQHAAVTQASLTGPAVAVGTSDYMAPEQAAGDPVDARTDLYALGCVLYAMLTGSPPFTGDSPLSVVSQHLHRAPTPVASRRPDLPAGLNTLVGQLLAKNPADRPGDAGEVRSRLAALTDQAAAAPPIGNIRSPAVPAAGAARATAAVVSPTQTLPTVDPGDDDYRPMAGRGPRLGLAGIAAVALGAAALAAILVAVLLNAARPPQAGPPATAASTSVSAPAPTGEPADRATAVAAAIQAQMQAGQLDPNAANDLANEVDEIVRHLADGETDKAAKKVADLRSRLAELRQNDKITTAGYAALLSSLDQLAAGLPPAEQD